jgi:type IV pilus assembly protein PilA
MPVISHHLPEPSPATSEAGFTMIELLVVILILGILATIALPTFLGQAHKADDAAAKEYTADLVKLVEACYANEQDYTGCNSLSDLSNGGSEPIGMPYGNGPNQAEVSASTVDSFAVTGHSRSGNTFTATRNSIAPIERTCSTAGSGGCTSAGTW